MPAKLIKSITRLIWYIGSMTELQISGFKGEESLWISDGWTEKFNLRLSEDTLDFKHPPEEAKCRVMIKIYLVVQMGIPMVFHEVTFIPEDLLFIHSDIQVLTPTSEVDSDCYIVIEAYQPLDMIE